MRILYITPYVPSPIRVRPYHLLLNLARAGHEVTLLAAGEADPTVDGRALAALEAAGIETHRVVVPRLRAYLQSLGALLRRQPMQAHYSVDGRVAARMLALLEAQPFDVVHIEHLRASRLVEALPPSQPTLYDAVDCIALLFEQAMRGSRSLKSRLITRLELEPTRRYEARLLARFRQVVVTSSRDKAALEALAARYLPPGTPTAPVTVITNGVDSDYFHPLPVEPEGRTVVFSGKMSYHANVAAAHYFVEEVLPRLWEWDASVRFLIVGKDPPESLRALGRDPRIEVTGYVEDLRPWLARAAVAVCPVRYAVGIQSKVLEALAMERPVVATPAAMGGLHPDAQEVVLVGRDGAEFAEAVRRLLADPQEARRRGEAGRRYVLRHHSWPRSVERLVARYEAALSSS